jgi:hypothetical protein
MPAYSSHLLQPLDVACFSPLKHAYGRTIDERFSRMGYDHIDKAEFLEAYVYARACAFKSATIRSGFRATGIAPFEPHEVIKRLRIDQKKQTPTPPGSSHSNSSSSIFQPTTPYDLRQMQRQARAIRAALIEDTTRAIELFEQASKGAEIAYNHVTILSKENYELRQANTRAMRRKATKMLAFDGTLTIGEGPVRFEELEV